MLYYVVIGISFMFLLEHSTERSKEVMEYYGEEVPKFNWFDRIFNIILWPITLGVFLKHVFEIFKK